MKKLEASIAMALVALVGCGGSGDGGGGISSSESASSSTTATTKPTTTTTTTVRPAATKPAGLVTPGLLTPGNIEARERQALQGRVVLLIGEGRVTLVPAVDSSGRTISNTDAAKLFQQTGRHLGVFRDKASATAYARTLSAPATTTTTLDPYDLNNYEIGPDGQPRLKR